MILRILLLLTAILPFTTPLQAGWWDGVKCYFKGENQSGPPAIRILVVHDVEMVKLEVQGKYSLYDPYANSYLSSRYVGKCRNIQAMSDGLKWGEAFPGLYQLKIKPDEPKTAMLVNDKPYDGFLYIYDIGGTISVVNQIPIEDYVASTLLKYQNHEFDPETWAALAIVARTNAYFQTINPKNTYWAVDAQKVGFNGMAAIPPMIADAVKMSRYMVMSRTGVYEGLTTPFAAQFDQLSPGQLSKDVQISLISLEEAQEMAQKGDHAAQILSKAFPGTTIMHLHYGSSAIPGQ